MAYSVTARRSCGVTLQPAPARCSRKRAVVYSMTWLSSAPSWRYRVREDSGELPDVVAHQVEVGSLEVAFHVQECLWTLAPGTGTPDFKHTGFDERGQAIRLAVVRLEAVFLHEVAEQSVGIGDGLPDVEAIVHHAVGIVVDVVLQRLDMGAGVFAGTVVQHGEYGWGSHTSMVARPANRASKKWGAHDLPASDMAKWKVFV